MQGRCEGPEVDCLVLRRRRVSDLRLDDDVDCRRGVLHVAHGEGLAEGTWRGGEEGGERVEGGRSFGG
jgi:hypothetical protein